MRISRDLGRPFVALVLVVGAVVLVGNVAAFRAASTTQPQHAVDGADAGGCPQATTATPPGDDPDVVADCETRTSVAATRTEEPDDDDARAVGDGDEDGDRDAEGELADGDRPNRDGRHIVIVTESGAS